MIHYVDSSDFDEMLPFALPHLEEAYKHAYYDYSLKDLFHIIRKGGGYLILDMKEDGIKGASILRRKGDILLIVLMSHTMEYEWMVALPELEDWARSIGIRAIELHGREGWGKVLKKFHYKTKYVVMRKVIGD